MELQFVRCFYVRLDLARLLNEEPPWWCGAAFGSTGLALGPSAPFLAEEANRQRR